MTDRRKKAESLVERSAFWAFACGLVPLPVLDVAALTLVLVRMLERLSELYEQPFSRVRAEAYVTASLGSLTSAELGLIYMKAGLSMIPVLGPLLGATSMSTTSAAITYAIGRLFIAQFEAGDAFLSSDPGSVQSAPSTEPPAAATTVEETEPEAPLPELPPKSAGDAESGASDDLTIVIGIGPKIATLLVTKGISTFAELAVTPVATLKTILHDAGARYALHDPTTWPEQAKLVSEGKLDQLAAFKSET